MNGKTNRKNQKNNQPAEWQTNPDNLTTTTVQYWRNGIMVTANMTIEVARAAVREGNAFIISEQAIGALVNGKFNS